MMRLPKQIRLLAPSHTDTRALLFVVSALLLFLLSVPGAHAQFSGPAISSSTTINRPLTPTTDPAILYPQGREIHLAPGDVIGVRVYGAGDYIPQAQVSLD